MLAGAVSLGYIIIFTRRLSPWPLGDRLRLAVFLAVAFARILVCSPALRGGGRGGWASQILERFQRLRAQQFQRAASDEDFCYGLAEVGGGCSKGGFVDDMSHLFAVGAYYHGVQVPVIVDAVAVGAEGELATSAQGSEDGALGGDGVFGVGVIESADGVVDGGVAGGVFGIQRVVGAAGFEGQRALAGGWG